MSLSRSMAFVGVVLMCPGSALAQPGGNAEAVPHLPWGAPDLQGVWDFRTVTPLERPEELAGKEFLTDEEAADFEEQLAATRVDRRPAEGSTGTYNQFWFDRGTSVVADRRTSLIIDPADGQIPAVTPAGRARLDELRDVRERPAHGPEDRNVAERCILGFNAGPPMEPRAYNNNVQLLQTADYVVLLNEMVHDVRVIPVDGRLPRSPRLRQWMGTSRGRWEGDTLVVETTGFYDQTSFSQRQGSTRDLHLVERFQRIDEGTLLYEFTVDDPTTWMRPWSVAVPMTRSEEAIYEYACHEGNYGMVNLLKGARAQDRAASKDAR